MKPAPKYEIPTTHDELFDPEWLFAVADDIAEDETIVSVNRTGESKTRAEKLRFSVTVDGPSGQRTNHYCAKVFVDGTFTGGPTEARFYRELAPRLGLRLARVPYAAVDGERPVILMEDLEIRGGTFQSPHFPISPASARTTLSQLARLHAVTWGLSAVADIDWLATSVTSNAFFTDAPTLQSLLDDGRADGFPAALCSGENLANALKVHRSFERTCVLHGDTHTGNIYIDKDGLGLFFDWETIQMGNWGQDVAYHLGASLSIDDRRAHERELVEHYLRELAANGGPTIGADEGFELYRRSFSYGYLLWVITRIRGRDEVLAHMPRLAAALDDHQTFKLLGVI